MRSPRPAALVVGFIFLVAASAVAGRLFLPELSMPSVVPAATATSEVDRAAAARLGRDFDALAASIRSAGANELGPVLKPSLTSRVAALRNLTRVTRLPTDAAGFYLRALNLLDSAIGRISDPLLAVVVTDLVNQAQAEWRKGDDALK